MAQAAMGPSFNEAVLRQSPSAIANRSYAGLKGQDQTIALIFLFLVVYAKKPAALGDRPGKINKISTDG